MEISNVYIETYGCSANQNNSEIIAGILRQAGLFIVKNPRIADLAILNTCIVKGPTQERMFSRARELSKRFGRNFIIAGCMPDIFSKEVRKISDRISLVGSHYIKDIAKAVRQIALGKTACLIGQKDEVKLCTPKIRSNSIIGITQILEGCVGKCTYCITKYAKGRLFSYPKEEIKESITNDLKSGCREIWLTSQDNAAYGLDNKKRQLPELLNEIFSIKGKFLVRLGMMNPNHVLPIFKELIDCYKNEKLFKFLHIPLQSGSNNILDDMKREYTKEDFLDIANGFRKEFPEITISTDIIVGYPTETKKDFKETIEAIKKTRPSVLNISKFWAMKGTEAEKLKGIDVKESKRRATELMNLHKDIAFQESKRMIGQTAECLVDRKGFGNTFLARDRNYRLIAVEGDKILGRTLKVNIADAAPHYLFGKIINDKQK